MGAKVASNWNRRDFTDWQDRLNLDNYATSQVLGVTERMVRSYASGSCRISLMCENACRWIEYTAGQK